ncbi:helix-turn-helix domain-containing protein [Streptomyces sp. NPDC087440]|uniref:helix-turn-helix domain-containing protein n=1 Tax=Streptomyces sp. NPDC087440 TaxID=3365790 RepID=UPI00381E988B
MSDFDAIDSLLSGVAPQVPLPDPAERRDLRERAHLSKARVAEALGVGVSTVSGWEAGRDPIGEVRKRYAYLLDGLRVKLAPEPEPDEEPEEEPQEEPAGAAAAVDDDVEVLSVPEPCVLCGNPAAQRIDGFAQHLDPAACEAACEPARASASGPAPSAQPAPDRKAPTRTTAKARPEAKPPRGRAFQDESGPGDLVTRAVEAALAEHGGDVDGAVAALVKHAIPDAMVLLDETRKGARYDVVAHPALPKILRKQTAKGADQIWEARPKWTRRALPAGAHEVTALDMNAAYLSALKTHLPIGQLEHSTGFEHDRRRAGVHLITPPDWDHDDVLPNPIGNRDEPGPLWVTEPTLRLLLRLSGPKHRLCEPPEIHESYTSGSTENLLEKFRVTLTDARALAIEEDDEVTLEYVKAMYSKFVSTMGESNYNRELYRQDWMHLIRSQAFANLWMKAWKAHEEGLHVVRAMGTDELHVVGDWRRVFPEGRGVTEVKVKDTYTVGEGS